MISSIILCGGKNSRISVFNNKIIKPLIKIKKKTILEHHLNKLSKIKIINTYINVHKNLNLFLELKKKKNLNFKIIKEKKLSGTAGVIIKNLDKFSDTVLVIYGDNFIKWNIKGFVKKFKFYNCDLLVGVYKKRDLSASGNVKFSKKSKIYSFEEKNKKLKNVTGYANAGLYLIKKDFLRKYLNKKKDLLDFGKDIFSKNISRYKCKVYKVKSCICFDTGKLYKKNLLRLNKISS